MPSKKILFAFDFDHTLLNDNTDLYIVKMVDGGLPKEVKVLYTKNNWTNYMCEVFKYLHQRGTGSKEMIEFMKQMSFAPGMKDLCKNINKLGHDQIIISDSNTVFIDTILKNSNLDTSFHSVFTNPGHFDEHGLLSVAYYHHQDWCSMSTVNMCKGHILDEFLTKQRENEGKAYDHIVYIGDGTNDLCPATRLKESDFLFARKGYRLEKILLSKSEEHGVKANYKMYSDGNEIWQWLESFA